MGSMVYALHLRRFLMLARLYLHSTWRKIDGYSVLLLVSSRQTSKITIMCLCSWWSGRKRRGGSHTNKTESNLYCHCYGCELPFWTNGRGIRRIEKERTSFGTVCTVHFWVASVVKPIPQWWSMSKSINMLRPLSMWIIFSIRISQMSLNRITIISITFIRPICSSKLPTDSVRRFCLQIPN